MKNYIIGLILLVLIGGAVYYFVSRDAVPEPTPTPGDGGAIDVVEPDPTTDTDGSDLATTTSADEPPQDPAQTVLGQSVEGRDIVAYHYYPTTAAAGEAIEELVFVGGIHGGYSWNTALLAYELMDYLEANPETIPAPVKVTVVPVMNPDGLYEAVGTTGRFTEQDLPANGGKTVASRFNANDVDLNRNFDCEWQTTAMWQEQEVSGGSAAFSEPESRAFREYVESNPIAAAVVWYSAAGGVYASQCGDGVLPETTELVNVYANAAGYPAYEEFDYYEITGDLVNWLAKEDIPAFSVLLTTHDETEWSKNRAGVKALMDHLAE